MPYRKKTTVSKTKGKPVAKKKRLVDKVFNRGGLITRLKGRTAKEMKKLGL